VHVGRDDLARRRLRGGREDRRRTHERHADHERARGARGAAGVACDVAAREAPDGPEHGHERRREPRDDDAGDDGSERQHAEHDRCSTDSEERPRSVGLRPHDGDEHTRDAERDERPAGDRPDPERVLLVDDVVAHGLDGRHEGRASGRDERRDEADQRSDADRDEDRRRVERDAARQGHAHLLEEHAEPGDETQAARDAERGADRPDSRGLQQDRREHLRRRRPDGPQQRELTHPLAHRHGERVGDDERTHEQRDPGEHQQERRDEPEGLLDGRLRLGAHRVTRDRLGLRGQCGVDPLDELRLGHPVLGVHREVEDRAGRCEGRDRRGLVDDDDRRAGHRAAERDLADDLDLLDLTAEHDGRRVTHVQTRVRERRGLERDLGRSGRQPALQDAGRRVVGEERRREGRRLGAGDRGAVRPDQDDRALDVGDDAVDAVDAGEVLRERQRDRVACVGLVLRRAPRRRLGAPHVGVAEHRAVDDARERRGEHRPQREGPRDERHPERDGEQRQQEADEVCADAAQRHLAHQ
jgi:hypothetical protein